MAARGKQNGSYQGMNWIRPATRLAIYLRDGLACAYCGEGVEDGAKMTLDHLKPYSEKPDHSPHNLVTCCLRCNSSRGDRPVATFAHAVAEYLNRGIRADDIIKHVRNCARRKLPREEARKLLRRRGTVAQALNTL